MSEVSTQLLLAIATLLMVVLQQIISYLRDKQTQEKLNLLEVQQNQLYGLTHDVRINMKANKDETV